MTWRGKKPVGYIANILGISVSLIAAGRSRAAGLNRNASLRGENVLRVAVALDGVAVDGCLKIRSTLLVCNDEEERLWYK